MALQLSLNRTGSTPNAGLIGTNRGGMAGSSPSFDIPPGPYNVSGSPKARALSNANLSTPMGSFKSLTPTDMAYGSSSGTGSPVPITAPNTQGLLPPTGQPIKSHTITNTSVDGSTVSHQQTYHQDPSSTASISATPPAYDKMTGLLTDYGKSKGMIDVNGAKSSAAVTPSPSSSDSSNPPAGADTSYGGLVGRLANQGNSAYNQEAQKNIGLLGDVAKGNQQYADNAKAIADAAGQKISDIGGQGARGEAGYLTTGTSPVGEGNAAVLGQTAAAQQQAVSQGANMQLAGNAQGLAAQGQKQSGYNSAAGESLTGQGTAQGALGAAAGYMQPTSNVILRDPTTGAVIGNQNLSDLAKMKGSLSGIESGAASVSGTQGSNTSDVITQLNSIDSTSPAFNANTSQLSDFASNGGLNKDVPLMSALQQHFGQNFMNDPSVTGFLSKINSVNSQYQQITGNPGTLDPQKITLAGLNTAIQSMKDDITNKRQALQDQKSKLDGSSSSSSSGRFSEGQKSSSGGYNFIFQNGKWMPSK